MVGAVRRSRNRPIYGCGRLRYANRPYVLTNTKKEPMQKFILLRGHQGSGKSTFAQEQINVFQKQYPDAEIIHIENDLLMTDENGNYRFTVDGIEQAQRKGQAMMLNACKRAQQNPQQPMLIINSNTNQKGSACIHLMQQARKHGLLVEVYRLHNFYPNHHGVKEADVLAAYIKLNNNRLREEIHVKAMQPMNAETAALIEEMQQFKQHELDYDENQQTWVTEKYLRLGRRDFVAKISKRYPELSVLKYKRNVFYDNRFDEALREMRGLVIDNHNRIIVRPFKKQFNYSERIAKDSKYPLHLDDAQRVDAVVKINGFLGCCTYVALPPEHPSHAAAFNQQVIYSTTGSLDSDFAKMVESHCRQYEALFKAYPNHTFLFEITDAKDVHIIQERLGETLIGVIDVASGRQFREDEVNKIAAAYSLQRPPMLENTTFGELKALLKTVKYEGFMVFDAATKETLFKLKSPYYLVSKFFGRSNENSLGRKLDKKHVDEEYYPLVDYLRAQRDTFNTLSEQEKIAFIQRYLENMIE